MARSMWKGSIAFGLVNIPIELYSATRDHRPKFRLLHAKDEEPVRYERVCQKEGKPVAWEDLVKGYEYARTSSSCSPRTTSRRRRWRRRRRSTSWTSSIPPRSTSATSRRRITSAGQRRRAGVCASARGDSRVGPHRRRQDHPARHATPRRRRGDRRRARPDDDALCRRARRPRRVPFSEEGDIRAAELNMAKQLIASLEAKWDPEKYTDEYKENLMRVITPR